MQASFDLYRLALLKLSQNLFKLLSWRENENIYPPAPSGIAIGWVRAGSNE
jgi:hypothetical protein